MSGRLEAAVIADGHARAAARRAAAAQLNEPGHPVAVPGVGRQELEHAVVVGGPPGESSATVRDRVAAARLVQRARAPGEVTASVNARLSPREVDAVARPDARGAQLLAAAMEKLGLSARAYAKVLRIARTIADLEGATAIRTPHVAEAIEYRVLDRAIDPAVRASA